MKDILEYHILPGLWTSDFFENNRAIDTAKGVQVVTFADASMGEGKLQLHDSCVDKPTPDPFSCADQVEFAKCSDPFMISPLAAQWKGGFCELTCKRCTCDPREGSSCASVGDQQNKERYVFWYNLHMDHPENANVPSANVVRACVLAEVDESMGWAS